MYYFFKYRVDSDLDFFLLTFFIKKINNFKDFYNTLFYFIFLKKVPRYSIFLNHNILLNSLSESTSLSREFLLKFNFFFLYYNLSSSFFFFSKRGSTENYKFYDLNYSTYLLFF